MLDILTKINRYSMVGPQSGLLNAPPDVGSAFLWTGITIKIVILESTLHLILRHAMTESSDTEGNVRSGGPILVLAGGPKPFKDQGL